VPLAWAADSPINKVLSMMSDLQAQIVKEGEVAVKEYTEFSEWCEDRSRDLGNEIKTGKMAGERLSAGIDENEAAISSLSTKIDEHAAAIAANEQDLKAATAIRKKEAVDFGAEEKELTETNDMIGRAITILERQAGGASMVQLSNAGSFVQALDTMVQASLIGTGDATKLTAFAQESGKDEDEALGAPAGAVYTSQGGGIVDALQDLGDKAESQLAETRKKEVTARQDYEMLKQSLTDEIAFATKELGEAKKGLAESTEKKATATGDLEVSTKELAEDGKAKEALHHDCMSKAESFAAETKSRGEELKALATAKKVVEEATGGSALDQVSFVQRSMLSSGKYEVVRLIRDLAEKHHSGALVQLASQMTVAMQSSGAFEKVTGMISDMIAKLEKAAGADATKKAFCDKELAESNAKKEDRADGASKLSTKIEQASAKSSQLKEEVAALETELSKLAKSQGEMDKLRAEEKAAFEESKAELDTGITGLQAALKVLREYYGQDGKSHESGEGAAGGILGLLEVIEADFSKNLAQITADEEAAVAGYKTVSKENEIERATKEQATKYKTGESKQLDMTSAELSSDRSGVQDELDAVTEYLTKIEAQCIAKADSYADRKESREGELAGLKQGLEILKGETALVQRRASRKTLRGAQLSVSA